MPIRIAVVKEIPWPACQPGVAGAPDQPAQRHLLRPLHAARRATRDPRHWHV